MVNLINPVIMRTDWRFYAYLTTALDNIQPVLDNMREMQLNMLKSLILYLMLIVRLRLRWNLLVLAN